MVFKQSRSHFGSSLFVTLTSPSNIFAIMLAGKMRSSSLAKSTMYAFTENLSITVKSGWKGDAFEEDRLKCLADCQNDDPNGNEDCDVPDLEEHQYKYTYVALQLGGLLMEMPHGTIWKTNTDQHFTIAYLPSIAPAGVRASSVWPGRRE